MSFPLYLDEHVDVELAALLTCGGLAVLTTQDAELSNKKTPDLDQLTFATQRRAILTHYIKDYEALSKQWAEEGRIIPEYSSAAKDLFGRSMPVSCDCKRITQTAWLTSAWVVRTSTDRIDHLAVGLPGGAGLRGPATNSP